MSTRALYTFMGTRSNPGRFNVYKRYDGYPSGALAVLKETLNYAWPLPRYEADEFAASFVAAAKNRGAEFEPGGVFFEHRGGGVRLMPAGDPAKVATKHCSDIEWRYEISFGPVAVGGDGLRVAAIEGSWWDGKAIQKRVFFGSLSEFEGWVHRGEGKEI